MLAGVASAAGRAAIHAVRVQIIPAPRSLVDSREILRILQSYGDVTTYRWLKHDALSSAPNSVMAIFADGDAMNRFLHECPLTFEIDRTERAEEDSAFNSAVDEDAEFSEGHPITNSNTSTAHPPPPPQKKPTYHTRPQLFRINADAWRGRHRDWLERHPFWGNFQPRRQTVVAQDLSKRVPLVGLSDIDANSRPEIPIRILNRRKEAQGRRPSVRDMMRDLRGEDAAQQLGKQRKGHWG